MIEALVVANVILGIVAVYQRWSSDGTLKEVLREHKLERQQLINQIMYQAGQTWTPPPARSDWTPPEPVAYDWSPKPHDFQEE